MVTRRKLILSGATGLLAAALPHSAFAAEAGGWKIDEITVDGKAWSLRAMLADFLKY